MSTLTPPIRNAARALIVQDNNILLLRKAGVGSSAATGDINKEQNTKE